MYTKAVIELFLGKNTIPAALYFAHQFHMKPSYSKKPIPILKTPHFTELTSAPQSLQDTLQKEEAEEL